MTSSETREVQVVEIGAISVSYTDRGQGRPVLLLHGGGGPLTVNPFADLIAAERPARVVTPVHPGFAGTSRSERLATIRGLAAVYVALLAELDLSGVTVVGNSIGGWIASEMALLDTSRISGVVLVDAVGIRVDGHPVVDFFAMTPRQVAEASYHDPDRFGIDPTKLAPEALQAMAVNRATLGVYAGAAMDDPTLAPRLAGIAVPTLVLWGDSDRIADADYGRAFAKAIPGAQFKMLVKTGHLPQIETPRQLLEAIWEFAESYASTESARTRD